MDIAERILIIAEQSGKINQITKWLLKQVMLAYA